MSKLDIHKTATHPEPAQSAKNSFSSVDVSTDTSPSDKELFISPESDSGNHAILRKSSKQVQLDMLKQEIISNDVCSSLAVQAKQMVFGSGDINAKVVFIGEAPGKKEDETGEPFIGAAGKLLNQMLESIGLVREDVYITNIVKYRPPYNRDPLPAEKSAFLPYLIRQLEIINPKLIVTLGRHSTNVLLPGLIINKVHGISQQFKEWVLLPLYHPAAALYNGSLRQTLFEDFAKIPLILEPSK